VLFGVGSWELIVILGVGLLLLGPDKLPGAIAEGAKWLRVLRDQATKARGDIMGAVDLDPDLTSDLRQTLSDISELHPKRIASSLISDAVNGPPSVPPAPKPATPNTGPNGSVAATAFDPDAT
jgi:sec-independent protein translocase protein TatB